MEKSLRYIIIGVLLGVHIYGIPAGFQGWPALVRAASYSFFHASWWHLAVNCLAVWTIFMSERKIRWGQLILAYLIAVAVYPLSLRPVIGASNFLYAVIALRTPPFSSPWWKKSTTVVFLLATAAMVFIPRIAGLTHIYSFAAGVFLAYCGRILDELTRDTRRYL